MMIYVVDCKYLALYKKYERVCQSQGGRRGREWIPSSEMVRKQFMGKLPNIWVLWILFVLFSSSDERVKPYLR